MSRPLGPNELLTQFEASRAANERLLADVEALRVKNALLDASLKNQDEEIASLRRERDEVVARNAQLLEERAAVDAQMAGAAAAARNEIESLTRQLDETTSVRNALNGQVVKLQAAVVGVKLTDKERSELTKEREEVIAAVSPSTSKKRKGNQT